MVDRDNGLKRALSIAMIGAQSALKQAEDNFYSLAARNTYALSLDEKQKLSIEYSEAQNKYYKLKFGRSFNEMYPTDIKCKPIAVVTRKPLFEVVP